MTADSTTRLREAMAEVAYGWWDDSIDAIEGCDPVVPLDERILASLVEHRDDVLDVLGMEQVVGGWWCPVHGNARCPEDYMLRPDGDPRAGYEGHWSENFRCGKRQPVYAFRPKEQPHGN